MVLIWMWLIAFYLVPTLAAICRQHHQTAAIFIINLFLGWTLLGWVLPLAWAFTATPKECK